MRMTVEEMKRKYPNTCIGITDIEFDAEHRIVAADVKYTDKDEITICLMAARGTGIRPFYPSPSDDAPALGALAESIIL